MNVKTKPIFLLLLSAVLPAYAMSAAAQDAGSNDEVIVTGSQFTNPNIISSSPITTIDETVFDRIGAVDAVDVLNRLPGVTAAQDSNVSNDVTGTSTINLRGLGEERNLVLINGKRLGPGTSTNIAADLNQVPTPLLERVDIVTGGASAVYGSDAIAGVTNFILKRDFEGLEFDGTFGFFQDSNDNDFIQEVLELTAVDGIVPTGPETDGQTFDLSAVYGRSFDNDRGHISAFGRYVDQNAVEQGTRDVSRCAIVSFGSVPGPVFCAGSDFGPFPTTFDLPLILELDGGLENPTEFLANGAGDFIDLGGNIVSLVDAVQAPAGFTGLTQTRALPFIANANGDLADLDGNIITNPADAILAPPNFTGPTISRQLLGSAAGTVSLDAAGGFSLGPDGNGLGPTNAFNFNPDNFFLRPTQRIQGGVFANYELTPNIEAYLDATYFRNETDAQVASSSTFGTVSAINCDNPFLTPELVETICTNRGFDLDDNASISLNRRFVESGPRNIEFELENIRLVGGLKGQLGSTDWDYDVFGQYASTQTSSVNTNDAAIALLNEAILVVEGANGPECSSGRDGCIPLNLFGTGPVDPDALTSILTPTSSEGEVNQLIFGATVQGALKTLASPFAENAFNLLAGIEYRRDRLLDAPDAILLAGAATGLGGPLDPVDASSDVIEIFGETHIPLIEDRPYFENLSLTGQVRFSDYSYDNNLDGGAQSDGFTTTAFSIGSSWSPVDDLRIRGQFQRAVRAPNIFELFAPVSPELFFGIDPCSGATPLASQAQCELTGLSADLFGLVPQDSGQLLQSSGGNTNLQPERSNTFTIGFILRPSAIEGLSLSVDYYDISIDDFISEVPSNDVLAGCIDGSQPDFCGLIDRNPLTGQLDIGGAVDASLLNIAERTARGFDIGLDYNFGLGAWGRFNLNYLGNLVTALEQTNFPGLEATESLGLFGGGTFTGEPNPAYRHNANLGWSYDERLGLNMGWRYFGNTQSAGEVPFGEFGSIFGPESFFDLSGQWAVSEKTELRFGINNIFDNDPPLTSFFASGVSGNTFPSTFDAFGRYIFFGGKIRLQ